MTSSSLNQTGERGLGRTSYRVLVLDMTEDTQNSLPRRIVDRGYDAVQVSCFADIQAALFEEYKPQVIIAPLLSKSTDALDLAEYLQLVEYTGKLVVVTEKLPNAPLVQREIARAAPGLTLEIAELDAGSDLREV